MQYVNTCAINAFQIFCDRPKNKSHGSFVTYIGMRLYQACRNKTWRDYDVCSRTKQIQASGCHGDQICDITHWVTDAPITQWCVLLPRKKQTLQLQYYDSLKSCTKIFVYWSFKLYVLWWMFVGHGWTICCHDKAAESFEVSVHMYQTTWHHIPKGSNHGHCSKKPKCHFWHILEKLNLIFIFHIPIVSCCQVVHTAESLCTFVYIPLFQ